MKEIRMQSLSSSGAYRPFYLGFFLNEFYFLFFLLKTFVFQFFLSPNFLLLFFSVNLTELCLGSAQEGVWIHEN